MIKLKNSKTILLLFSVCLLATACLPPKPAERTAVVIFNDMNNPVSYYLELSNNLTAETSILPDEFDYALEYDANPGEPLTSQLTKILIISLKCTATLNREDLLRYMAKDPEGRNTWDLHITKNLLSTIGCN